MKIMALFFILMFPFSLWSQEITSDPKVIYKYKKFEKFDFEDLVIEGETGGPGDLSISSRFQKQFQNKLPYRKNFNAEIRKGIERVR